MSRKSVEKSASRTPPKPFKPGPDARRGRGPKKGAPNAGRTPSIVRAALRDSFETRYRVWEEIADDAAMPPGERRQAVDMLAKYGLGTRDELEVVSPDVQERLAAQAKLIASRKTWAAKDLLAALDGVWM